MKKLLWLFPLTIILYACPFESAVPLAAAPMEPVDSSLCGYWYGIINDFSDAFGIEALDISKQSDSVYAITRYGKAVKGDMIMSDTAYFTGYTSYIGKQRFLNVEGSVLVVTPQHKKQPILKNEKIYYLAAIENQNDTLSVRMISEDFSTRKNFKSPEELKKLVIDLTTQNQNIYDKEFSLSYRKIPKPQPLKHF